jgi:hypothetical protein
MIQLANEPTASRTGYRPVARSEGKGSSFETQRGRPGHAWPFLSRYAARPSKQDGPTNAPPTATAADSGTE